MTQMNADYPQITDQLRNVAALRRQWTNPEFKPLEFVGFGNQLGIFGCEINVQEVNA